MGMLIALRQALVAALVAHQYGGLFLLLLAEEAGVPLPLPGDKLLMWEGMRSRDGHVNAALVLLLVSAAVTLGSTLLYWAARRGGRPALQRYGRFLRLRQSRIDSMEARFRRWGPWAIIVGRLVPGVRIPTSIMAGIFAVPFRVYFPCTALSAVIWTVFYFAAGIVLERPARQALALFRHNVETSVGFTVLLIGLGLTLTLAVRRARLARRSREIATLIQP
jgi:membrane protein DedA with SNARE-associated domain